MYACVHCRSTFKGGWKSQHSQCAIDSRMIDAVAVILPLHAHNLSVAYSSCKYKEVPAASLWQCNAPSAIVKSHLRLPQSGFARAQAIHGINLGALIIGIDNHNETKLLKNLDRQFAARNRNCYTTRRKKRGKIEVYDCAHLLCKCENPISARKCANHN